MPTETLLGLLDYAGVLVFGATGALAAARRGHDLVTFAFFAAMTGLGGGTLRDLLIGAPVFWVGDAGYIAVTALAALAIWVLGPRPRLFGALLWLDAVGLAAYAVIGAAKAAAFGLSPLVCVLMGAITATFGGVLRDVLAGEPSVLLRREITVTAALAASGVFLAAGWAGLAPWAAAATGAVCGFALRAGALLWGWSLPAFRDRRGGGGSGAGG
ncbi:MAG TPA: trimeric intracellular cation channel family protein [Caulobacteraceae bacterium]|jgi:uncharacterized membrane protein YeiH